MDAQKREGVQEALKQILAQEAAVLAQAEKKGSEERRSRSLREAARRAEIRAEVQAEAQDLARMRQQERTRVREQERARYREQKRIWERQREQARAERARRPTLSDAFDSMAI